MKIEEAIELATIGVLNENPTYVKHDFMSVVDKNAGAYYYLLKFADFCEESKIVKSKENFDAWISSQAGASRKIAEVSNAIFAELDFNKAQAYDGGLVYQAISSYNDKEVVKNAIQKIFENEKITNDELLTSADLRAFKKIFDDTIDSLEHSDEVLVDMPVMDTEAWSEKYQKDFKDREEGKFYTFGNWMDEIITDGPTPGNGGIIAASTGMGKSAVALNVINDIAFNKPEPTPLFYATLEMGATQTMDRLLSMRSGVPYKDIVRPDTELDALENLKKEIEPELEKIKSIKTFRITENPSISLRKLRKMIQDFQKELVAMGKDPYCVVVIDLLTMIAEFSKMVDGLNLAQAIEVAMNLLNAMAKELGIFYIGIVQLNRSVENVKVTSLESIEQLKPQRAAIKNANAILERCRWCISLFRRRYYADAYLDPEVAELVDDEIEISVLKQNNGKVGHIKLLFDGDTFSLEQRQETDVDPIL